MNKTAYRDLVRFRSGLPEHVLQAIVDIRALFQSAPTDLDDCEYCVAITDVMDGEGPEIKVCSHYERLREAWYTISKIEDSLTKEENDLLHRSECLERKSTRAWDYAQPDWQVLPEGFYAVPDPREGVEQMTYWRRKDVGKRKHPEFEPWKPRGAKVRYGPTLFTNDPRLKKLKGDEKSWFVLSWYETVGHPYRDAIIETILEDPALAAKRFAEWNMRCCMCGRALTHEDSKTLGIGPECGKGFPKEVLAEHFQMQVGELHAASL